MEEKGSDKPTEETELKYLIKSLSSTGYRFPQT